MPEQKNVNSNRKGLVLVLADLLRETSCPQAIVSRLWSSFCRRQQAQSARRHPRTMWTPSLEVEHMCLVLLAPSCNLAISGVATQTLSQAQGAMCPELPWTLTQVRQQSSSALHVQVLVQPPCTQVCVSFQHATNGVKLLIKSSACQI